MFTEEYSDIWNHFAVKKPKDGDLIQSGVIAGDNTIVGISAPYEYKYQLDRFSHDTHWKEAEVLY